MYNHDGFVGKNLEKFLRGLQIKNNAICTKKKKIRRKANDRK